MNICATVSWVLCGSTLVHGYTLELDVGGLYYMVDNYMNRHMTLTQQVSVLQYEVGNM